MDFEGNSLIGDNRYQESREVSDLIFNVSRIADLMDLHFNKNLTDEEFNKTANDGYNKLLKHNEASFKILHENALNDSIGSASDLSKMSEAIYYLNNISDTLLQAVKFISVQKELREHRQAKTNLKTATFAQAIESAPKTSNKSFGN